VRLQLGNEFGTLIGGELGVKLSNFFGHQPQKFIEFRPP
jgi:hypothetical protein